MALYRKITIRWHSGLLVLPAAFGSSRSRVAHRPGERAPQSEQIHVDTLGPTTFCNELPVPQPRQTYPRILRQVWRFFAPVSLMNYDLLLTCFTPGTQAHYGHHHKTAYNSAVNCKFLYKYKPTYNTSTIIHIVQFSSFFLDNKNCPTRLPAVKKPSAYGTSVSVYLFRKTTSAANNAPQSTIKKIFWRNDNDVTCNRSSSLLPRRHCHHPHIETRINMPCNPISPYSFASKNTAAYKPDDTIENNHPQ